MGTGCITEPSLKMAPSGTIPCGVIAVKSFQRNRLVLQALLSLVCLLENPSLVRGDEVVYLERGSVWRYLPGLAEASTPDHAAWRHGTFDDAAWEERPSPFGYGETPLGTDLSQLDPPMRNTYSSFFLRQILTVMSPESIVDLRVRASYDDAFILWINGHELLRQNVSPSPEGEAPFDSTATGGHESGTYEEFPLDTPETFLDAGENTVAVQVFNATLSSSDAYLDMEIIDVAGPDLVPPVVTRTSPSPTR